MKTKIRFLTLIFFIFLLFLATAEFFPALAGCIPGICRIPRSCAPPTCSDCPWCRPEQREIYNPALVETIQKLTGVEFLNLFLPNIITIFFVAATVIALFVLIIGGIKWITSAGDKVAAESARKTITAAVIGLVVVFSIYAILRLLELILGIKLIIIDISPLILK